jgi:transposase
VARYGKEYKDRVVARLLPPESAPVDRVSSEVGVSSSTLERWLAEALEAASGGEPPRRVWTAAARLEAVIATAGLDETAKSAWCRAQGVYPQELAQWGASALSALGDPKAAADAVSNGAPRRRVKELERELRRKDRTLAEAAALLVLSKKLSAIFQEDGDE